MAHLKAGTRIAVLGFSLLGERTEEAAKIARVMPSMLPLPAGYHPVRFADGARLLIHESGFRVTDNRRAA